MSFYRIKFLKQNASISATITNAWHFYAQANSLQCRYYHHHRLQRIDPFISSVHYNNQVNSIRRNKKSLNLIISLR